MDLKISNIRVNINFLFILMIAFAIVAGMYKEVLSVILALGVHEYAHILVGHKIGVKIHEIEILPFGGRIKSSLDEASTEEELLTVLAGPLGNFLAAGLNFFLDNQRFIPREIGKIFIQHQLMLGLFNMLPALPLDGGRLFVLWLRQYMGYTSSVRIASQSGRLLACLMLLFAFIGLLYKKTFLSFFVSGFFLLRQTGKYEKSAQLIFMKHLTKKKERLYKRSYLPGEILIVNGDTDVKKLLGLFDPQKYFIVYILGKNMEIKKYLTESEIFDIVIQKGLDLKVKDLI